MLCPWNEKLFKVSTTSKILDNERKETFHTFVMRFMYLTKYAQPDILIGVVFLSTRVLKPNADNWEKVIKILNYLNLKKKIMLKLEAEDITNLKWYVDLLIETYLDFKSHTGSVFSLGKGVVCSNFTKQNTNAQSSTEAE